MLHMFSDSTLFEDDYLGVINETELSKLPKNL
jgi:hypothetical protein